ncbi:hypothetical protein NKG94_35295 [Micromonospora sp. M12]
MTRLANGTDALAVARAAAPAAESASATGTTARPARPPERYAEQAPRRRSRERPRRGPTCRLRLVLHGGVRGVPFGVGGLLGDRSELGLGA